MLLSKKNNDNPTINTVYVFGYIFRNNFDNVFIFGTDLLGMGSILKNGVGHVTGQNGLMGLNQLI
jgi:hypothetical protein